MNSRPAFASNPWDPALLAVAGISLVVRLALIGWYRGEYTDGILQLELFANANTYLPPLFTVLHWIPRSMGLDPVLSGRLVSILATVLVLFPLHSLTFRLYGLHAARYAIVFYALMAVPNRWSLRVMTDPLFTLFFVLALQAFVAGSSDSTGSSGLRRRFPSLAALILWSGLAALTRYQGLVFVPLIAWRFLRPERPSSLSDYSDASDASESFESAGDQAAGNPHWATVLALAPWLALGAWAVSRGVTHGAQFSERMGASLLETALRYGDMAETFLVYLPYAITWPVAAGCVLGMVCFGPADTANRRLLGALAYLFPVWLAAHAAFQSFQYRYFLPLMPLFALYAGHGFTVLEYRLWRQTPGSECACGPSIRSLARLPAYAAFAWALVFTGAVLTLQRDAFADMAEASRKAGELARLSDTGTGIENPARIFTTETYGPPHRFEVGVKTAYWSGRPVEYLFENSGGAWRIRGDLRAGDLILLSNVYGDLAGLQRDLARTHRTELVAQYRHTLWPLLPDLMVTPPVTSQPLCMAYRYHRQTYDTALLRIRP